MPQESSSSSSLSAIFMSPNYKNMRGLKGLVNCGSDASSAAADEIINDRELAHRKADEAAARRNKAAAWLREMDHVAAELLPKKPTEEEFCLALRNGLILCNVLNRVNPGAVLKVVENRVIDVPFVEGAAQSAIQYFENTRNFLVAVADMKLLTFEASDLEKGGSSGKVVECILCLKGYYEWKQSGGNGVWRYGGTVKIESFPKGPPSSTLGSESADESFDDSESSHFEQLLDYLHFNSNVSLEESDSADAFALLFDRFGLALLQTYFIEFDKIEDMPLNSMVIDIMMRKVAKDFSTLLVSRSNQLSHHLKKILSDNCNSQTKSQLVRIILMYLDQRSNSVSGDLSRFCSCGGKQEMPLQQNGFSVGDADALDLQHRQLMELRSFSKQTEKEFQRFQTGCEEEFGRLELHIKSLEVSASSYHKVLEENRVLYNQVQDLKGTIRVYCRVRPFLPGESDKQSSVDYIGENGDIMIVNPYKQGKDTRRIFTFNKVFGANATQQQIYTDTQPLVRSVLDGFNACIFAYGQTGSGKTYTMSGPDLTSEETWGVNYRALNDLFQMSNERMDVVKYEVGVQMIEIYNEQVRDLLVIDGANRRLDVRNTSQLNGLNVPDACLIPVKCTQDVLDLMTIGQKNRAVGATALNERSSRSHSILTVHVRGKELVSESILRGCLHLVDLAGSERVDKSEAVGDRLKEAQHINRSLSALGDVISALAQKSSHIPYRNSKLTQVLQESLGGHAKTLMFVHINPEVNAIGETISTLKFAERVATIELGAARSNKETGEIREYKDEISNLKAALEKKEAEIQQLRSGAAIRGAVSPQRMPKCNVAAQLKTEISMRANDETRISEVRSCSSGKQRRNRPPTKFTDKDTIPKMPFLAEERSIAFVKTRSPSPPVRRSISTDRGAYIKSRTKPDILDKPPAIRVPFPGSIPVNKSITAVSAMASSGDNYVRVYPGSLVQSRQDGISETLQNLQRFTLRKVHEEDEEEQFKQALNVRQGGIRKINKLDGKSKSMQQIAKVSKPDLGYTLLSNIKNGGGLMDDIQKSEISGTENEQGNVVLPMFGNNARVKKMQRNLPRNSQNVEPREMVPPMETLFSATHENKIPNHASISDLRRSRSTPRRKFFVLP